MLLYFCSLFLQNEPWTATLESFKGTALLRQAKLLGYRQSLEVIVHDNFSPCWALFNCYLTSPLHELKAILKRLGIKSHFSRSQHSSYKEYLGQEVIQG